MQWEKLNLIFIGSRQRVSPFPTYLSFEIFCRDVGEFVPAVVRDGVCVFEKNIGTWFAPKEVWQGTSQVIARAVFDNPQLFSQLTAEHNRHAKAFVSFTQQAADEVRAGGVSGERLLELYEGFEPRYRKIYSPYAPVWLMGDALSDALYNIVLHHGTNPIKAAEILNILTQEPSAMVTLTERRALLILAINIQKHKDWVKTVKERQTKEADELSELIDRQQKEFFWLTRDYEDPILTYDDVVDRLARVLAGNPEEELRTLTESRETVAKKRADHIQSLSISPEHQALFTAMREATHLKELRKKSVSSALYYFDTVLQEIVKRSFLTIAQIRFLKTSEVRGILLEDRDMTDELNERMRVSLWYSHDGSDTEVITGKEAQAFRDKFCAVNKDTTEFQGVGVSPGVAKGPVKIVMNPDECGKVEKGDVIVSIQTVPSFTPAIMKAAALVCDGGTGMTSHPATLAREAGIPAVIQTRFAREVLRDGQLVEVDGNRGIVRIVS